MACSLCRPFLVSQVQSSEPGNEVRLNWGGWFWRKKLSSRKGRMRGRQDVSPWVIWCRTHKASGSLMTITGFISARILSVAYHFKTILLHVVTNCMCSMYVLWMCIYIIYYIYIYMRFSDLIRVWCRWINYWAKWGTYRVSSLNPGHSELCMISIYVYSAYPMQYLHCHVKPRTHASEPAIFYL